MLDDLFIVFGSLTITCYRLIPPDLMPEASQSFFDWFVVINYLDHFSILRLVLYSRSKQETCLEDLLSLKTSCASDITSQGM